MYVKRFKDLEVDDRVEYKDVRVHDDLTISGEGNIFGFSTASNVDWVWITLDSGEIVAVAYEEVKKI